MTCGEALAAATARLSTRSDSARLDAELLLAHVLGRSRSSLFAYASDVLDPLPEQRFAELVAQRSSGAPVAYLTGRKEFWSMDLRVGPGVLVPRPDTEVLVEWALECLPRDASGRIVDLGTGSGAIALALAQERPQAQVWAVERSAEALAIAKANAERLLPARVRMVPGDWWNGLSGRFALAVSNPPYIAAQDPHLAALTAEPYEALSDGGDGLGALRAIISGAADHLEPGAWLLLEHGWDQAAAVRGLLAAAGFTKVSTRRDLGGNERASGGRWSGTGERQ